MLTQVHELSEMLFKVQSGKVGDEFANLLMEAEGDFVSDEWQDNGDNIFGGAA